MKTTGKGGRTEAIVLKEIRDILLRIEEHLLSDKKKSEVELKKQLLND